FDPVGQALSGFRSLLVDPARPEAFGPTFSDYATAMYASHGVLAALVQRGRTGRGKRIEVNMLEASMAFIQDIYLNYTRTGTVSGKFARIARSQAFVFSCADDLMVAVHLSTTEKFWRELAAALDAPELTGDERFKTHQSRVKHYHELADTLQARFRRRSREHWIELLAGTDVPFAPVNDVNSALADPQVEALGTLARMRHGEEGEVAGIASPLLADGVRVRREMRAPPRLGEHTAEVLAEIR
ncbi:MAG: CoA transferase, partial [Hyphomicrobiaceae bacterium]